MEIDSQNEILQDIAEQRALDDIIASFLYYATYFEEKLINARLNQIDALKAKQRLLLATSGVTKKIKGIKPAISANYRFFLEVMKANPVTEESITISSTLADLNNSNAILEKVEEFFDKRSARGLPPAPVLQLERLMGSLNMVIRDWSAEGHKERELTYTPVLKVLDTHFAGVDKDNRSEIKVLVPGAGLGRLAYEIAKLDFFCQGNEFSYLMLMVSNYILNYCKEPESVEIYPFIHDFSNVMAAEDQLRQVKMPDVSPFQLLSNGPGNFSMAGGDFLEVYQEDFENWDAIVSCFFIDTAKNPLEYIQSFYRILKPGGIWINIGPLLWHYENDPSESSIELTFEEYIAITRKIGFIISMEESNMNITTSYSRNAKSMLTYLYKTPMIVAYKPLNT